MDPKASPRRTKKAAFQLLVKDKKPKTFKPWERNPKSNRARSDIYQSRQADRGSRRRRNAGRRDPRALLGFAFRKKTKNRIYKA